MKHFGDAGRLGDEEAAMRLTVKVEGWALSADKLSRKRLDYRGTLRGLVNLLRTMAAQEADAAAKRKGR